MIYWWYIDDTLTIIDDYWRSLMIRRRWSLIDDDSLMFISDVRWWSLIIRSFWFIDHSYIHNTTYSVYFPLESVIVSNNNASLSRYTLFGDRANVSAMLLAVESLFNST